MKKFILILLAVCSMALSAKEPLRRERIMVFERSTWNALDAVDDTPGYDRSLHLVEQSVFVPSHWAGGEVTFVSLGANQELTLSVNGREVGRHAGGYTAFSFDVTPFLRFGQSNVISAAVTNEHNPDIPPLGADFTFFGGLYRDCFLQLTPKAHFSTTFFATNGLSIDTDVTDDLARLFVTARLTNAPRGASVQLLLDGKEVARKRMPKNGIDSLFLSCETTDFEHWSPQHPKLYSLTARLLDKHGKLLDEVQDQVGFRYFFFDERGFFHLNSRSEITRLIGTNRHQCYRGVGWAVPDSIHRKDILAIKAMGANFLRVSHYPQDPLVMHLCDSLGIICSVEIPVVNRITESDAFFHSSLTMAEEMVWQNRNHPSVVLWGMTNEILLDPPFRYQQGMAERHKEYLGNVNRLSSAINDRFHRLDPRRFTFAAFHDDIDEYHRAGLDTLVDVVGLNLYLGWYTGRLQDLDGKVNYIRSLVGSRPMIMTEFGADCDVRLRSAQPERHDYTIDYALLFHQYYLRFLLQTDQLAGGAVWNLNDFHSEVRAGAIPHLNVKGLITLDRRPKATYYYYQTQLLSGPERAEAQRLLDSCMLFPEPQQMPVCMLLGSTRSYTDSLGLLWEAERPYEPGNWGYVDGYAYRHQTGFGPLPAKNASILNTAEDAIYQTARINMRQFVADVPAGQYMLALFFAELETVGEQEMSPYNLGNRSLDTGFTGRKQTVRVNGRTVLEDWSPEYHRATDFYFPVSAPDGRIVVDLEASEGLTLLNAVMLYPFE